MRTQSPRTPKFLRQIKRNALRLRQDDPALGVPASLDQAARQVGYHNYGHAFAELSRAATGPDPWLKRLAKRLSMMLDLADMSLRDVRELLQAKGLSAADLMQMDFETSLLWLLRRFGEQDTVDILNNSLDLDLRLGDWLLRSQSACGYWSNDFGWCYNVESATGYYWQDFLPEGAQVAEHNGAWNWQYGDTRADGFRSERAAVEDAIRHLRVRPAVFDADDAEYVHIDAAQDFDPDSDQDENEGGNDQSAGQADAAHETVELMLHMLVDRLETEGTLLKEDNLALLDAAKAALLVYRQGDGIPTDVTDALGLLLSRMETLGSLDLVRDKGPLQDARNALSMG